eukprot:TRINITY_DN2183_c0_g2_i3.p2 TRINITY_DN2183_c0_g2~~TRINITY_DN2183_c0_g2_i3.p2  ORF type:complete len:101 (+),score=18.03 TRINITY_DN2183_c0_g2_i3:81-383(+)
MLSGERRKRERERERERKMQKRIPEEASANWRLAVSKATGMELNESDAIKQMKEAVEEQHTHNQERVPSGLRLLCYNHCRRSYQACGWIFTFLFGLESST